MTAHFTTADGCERWVPNFTGHEGTRFYRQPIQVRTPRDERRPFTTPSTDYQYRTYEMESVDYARGLINYVEVYGA